MTNAAATMANSRTGFFMAIHPSLVGRRKEGCQTPAPSHACEGSINDRLRKTHPPNGLSLAYVLEVSFALILWAGHTTDSQPPPSDTWINSRVANWRVR